MKNFTIKKGTINDAKNSHNYIIYCDKSTKKIWCNVYSDCNSWSDYHDDNIMSICGGTGSYSLWGFDGLTREKIIEKAKLSIEMDNCYN